MEINRKENFNKKLDKYFGGLKKRITYRDSINICNIPIMKLIDKIQNQELSKIQVLEAFQYMAILAHKETNCLVDFDFHAKNNTSEKIDSTKLLDGVPISTKDNIVVANFECTMGCAQFIGKFKTKNGSIAQTLIYQGAILFCRTNMSQIGYSYHTDNYVFGKTFCSFRNSKNEKLSSGGSSGGEGALISFGGSQIGIGTDVCGSVRIPAALCGICGLKPTCGRIGFKGPETSKSRYDVVKCTAGPLSKDVDGLVVVMKALLTETLYKLDFYTPPLLFRNNIYISNDKIKIGYFIKTEGFHVLPCMERAVNIAVDYLKKFGHELIEWIPIYLKDIVLDVVQKGMFFGKVESFNKLIDGIHCTNELKKLHNNLNCKYENWKNMDIFERKLLECKDSDSLKEYREYLDNSLMYQEKVLNSLNENGIDILISPSFAYPSGPICEYPSESPSWPLLYVTGLNFVGGVLPVTNGNEKDYENQNQKTNLNPFYLKECPDPRNLPLTIQIIGKPFCEEMVLNIMKKVEISANYKRNL